MKVVSSALLMLLVVFATNSEKISETKKTTEAIEDKSSTCVPGGNKYTGDPSQWPFLVCLMEEKKCEKKEGLLAPYCLYAFIHCIDTTLRAAFMRLHNVTSEIMTNSTLT